MTQKYTILDENQEPQGFLILNQPEQIIKKDMSTSHLSDSIFLVVCLLSFSLSFWLTIGIFWISISIAIPLSTGLIALKFWRNGNGDQPNELPPAKNMTIKIESRVNNTFYLDEIEDKSISLSDLKKVAEAIIIMDKNFSRPALEKIISQNKYHKIKEEFIRMNFAHKQGNNYILSPRAYSFLKKINSLPHQTG